MSALNVERFPSYNSHIHRVRQAIFTIVEEALPRLEKGLSDHFGSPEKINQIAERAFEECKREDRRVYIEELKEEEKEEKIVQFVSGWLIHSLIKDDLESMENAEMENEVVQNFLQQAGVSTGLIKRIDLHAFHLLVKPIRASYVDKLKPYVKNVLFPTSGSMVVLEETKGLLEVRLEPSPTQREEILDLLRREIEKVVLRELYIINEKISPLDHNRNLRSELAQQAAGMSLVIGGNAFGKDGLKASCLRVIIKFLNRELNLIDKAVRDEMSVKDLIECLNLPKSSFQDVNHRVFVKEINPILQAVALVLEMEVKEREYYLSN